MTRRASRPARRAMVMTALAAMMLPAPSAVTPRDQTPDARELVRRTAAYVARYAADLKFVLADEHHVQRRYDRDGRQTEERRMRGELFLAFLPADGVWMAVHDVAEVDGVPVPGRDALRALLRQGEVTSVARRVADRNASFNLGSIQRNFNEPTLPLLLFDRTRIDDVRFRRRQRDDRVVLEFAEPDRPTLVRSRRGAPVPSRGEIAIEPDSGRVESTIIEMSTDGIRVRLETTYAPDEKLGLWVPSVFTEWYRGSPDGEDEMIVCEAAYSNYRRFEVVGRIK
jgi:hypothetical protein